MGTLRKQRMVTLCWVDETANQNQNLKYMSAKNASHKTKLTTQVRAPINEYNLVMLELFPEVKVSQNQEDAEFPTRLNFISLCCPNNAIAEELKLDFEKGYEKVEQVDFTGHIGSMRLAFDLLRKLPECKEVVFIMNDYNVHFPHGAANTFFGGGRQYWKVESVKIMHDNTIMEKSTSEVQHTGNWRVDEILEGCKECFPNLRKIEVCICGTGANFDKVNRFVTEHPNLRRRYTVEINHEKVRTRQRPDWISYQKSISFPPSSGPKVLSKVQGTPGAMAELDLSIVKSEKMEEEIPLNHVSLSHSLKELERGYASILGLATQEHLLNPSNNGNDVPSQCAVLPTGSYANFPHLTENKSYKALIWKGEVDTTSDLRQQPLIVSPSEPQTSHSVSGSGTEYMASPRHEVHQRTARQESMDSYFYHSAENDNARILARNPSPPPISERQPVTNPPSTTENNPSNLTNQVYENRRPVPKPPVISRGRGLVNYSREPTPECSDERNASNVIGVQQGCAEDPRNKDWQKCPFRSTSPHQRDRNRSRSRRRNYSPSHQYSPPRNYRRSQSISPHHRKFSRSQSRSSQRKCSRSQSRSPQRQCSRSLSRSPRRKYSRSQSQSRSPRRNYSRSSSRSYSPGPRNSHRKHYSEHKRFFPYSRRSRSRSSSPSSRSDSNYTYRGAGRGNYRGGFKGQYNPALRRGRGRGIRGARFRGRGRGRGNRGYNKPVHHTGPSYYASQRELSENENWEDSVQDQNNAT